MWLCPSPLLLDVSLALENPLGSVYLLPPSSWGSQDQTVGAMSEFVIRRGEGDGLGKSSEFIVPTFDQHDTVAGQAVNHQ